MFHGSRCFQPNPARIPGCCRGRRSPHRVSAPTDAALRPTPDSAHTLSLWQPGARQAQWPLHCGCAHAAQSTRWTRCCPQAYPRRLSPSISLGVLLSTGRVAERSPARRWIRALERATAKSYSSGEERDQCPDGNGRSVRHLSRQRIGKHKFRMRTQYTLSKSEYQIAGASQQVWEKSAASRPAKGHESSGHSRNYHRQQQLGRPDPCPDGGVEFHVAHSHSTHREKCPENRGSESQAANALADSMPAVKPPGYCDSSNHERQHQPVWDATASHIRETRHGENNQCRPPSDGVHFSSAPPSSQEALLINQNTIAPSSSKGNASQLMMKRQRESTRTVSDMTAMPTTLRTGNNPQCIPRLLLPESRCARVIAIGDPNTEC